MQTNSEILKSINEYIGDEYLNTVEKGRKFLCWSLYYLFDKTDGEIESQDIEEGVLICDGCNDGGVDAAFKENDSIHILQTKYGLSHSTEQTIAFINKIKDFLLNEDKNNWNECTSKVYSITQEIDEMFIYYITNEEIGENDYKKISRLAREVEDSLSSIYEEKRIVIRILDCNTMGDFIDENTSAVPRSFKGAVRSLTVERYFQNKQRDTIIAEVALKNLALFINKSEKYLFYSNIRNFLGKNKVNKQIANTYESNPKDFWFYNNGITIVCEDFPKMSELRDGAAKIDIKTPQIVNGCQTASTIYSVWKKQKKEEKNSQEGTILVKIIKDTNNKRKDITRYTNNQTAVTGKDFFALEDFHQRLKKDFKELGYSYEIQRRDKPSKAKGVKKYSYLFDKKFKNSFFVKDVVQAFAAGMHFKPSKARSISNLVPGGSYYDKLFNDEYTPKDPRYYLFSYGVMYYSKYVLQHNNNDKLKSSNLLYITTYFKILLQIFIRLDFIDDDVVDIVHCDVNIIDYMDLIFSNDKLNKQLLLKTESVLKDFFKDSKIKEIIGDNLPRFLKANVENDPDVVNILNDKIKDLFDDGEIDINYISQILNM